MILFLYFSLGCGIGYGYLHRIPIRIVSHTNEPVRKSSNNSNSPLLTATNLQPMNNETVVQPSSESAKNLANAFAVNKPTHNAVTSAAGNAPP